MGIKRLHEMTWKEAKSAFEKIKTAIIPTGSTEQHGPHLPLGTDWIVANEISAKVAEKVNAIVLPVIPYGWAEYHMDFPGTIYVEKENFCNTLLDICKSLDKWGIKRIVFVNGHGGNLAVLHTVATKIRKRYGMPAAVAQWWDILPKKINGHITETHGGVVETAIMLAINPNIVNLDAAIVPKVKPLTEKIETTSIVHSKFEDGIVRIFLRSGDVSEHGSMTEVEGATEVTDFSDATPELGKKLLSKLVDHLAKFINEFEKVKLPKPIEE